MTSGQALNLRLTVEGGQKYRAEKKTAGELEEVRLPEGSGSEEAQGLGRVGGET